MSAATPPGSPSRVTLSDVAAASGVSVATVSRVLHGGATVRAEVSQRVRTAADTLGYSVNRHARTLRRGRDDAIGIVVEDFTIPFFGTIVAVAERMARARGYGVVIACAGTGSTSEEFAVTSLLSRSVSGLVISNGAGPAPSGYLPDAARGMPVVVVDAPRPDTHFDSVTVDNRHGGRLATAHLVAQGHRDIAFVGSALTARTVALRHEGYRQALDDAGLQPRKELEVWAGHRVEDVRTRVQAALRRLPAATAVFSSGMRTTPGSLSAAVALQRADLAFVGFDDMEGADAFNPGLTVVDQHPETAGITAMTLLFDRIDGYQGPARHVQLDLTLHQRGSGERPPRPGAGEPAAGARPTRKDRRQASPTPHRRAPA